MNDAQKIELTARAVAGPDKDAVIRWLAHELAVANRGRSFAFQRLQEGPKPPKDAVPVDAILAVCELPPHERGEIND